MTFSPQVETAEISDADLDHVSGGQAVSAGIDAGAAVVLGHGSVGVGVYAEAGPLCVSAGIGGSVGHAGDVRTTML
ncbi:hypothetical protein ADK41_02845 [Streptomyces caelestis]|uniref:Type A2 lantipeptide n=2 Tax=Streptomyces TaxID=1883 RepID=A0A0M9XB28_9ACTN|nr:MULTISPECIES: hypothetical protein [Streptomyces]KOT45470.1 hypothetical protein ADK41_02845 [Streptomyces caelestis]KOV35093.1 hypothetical protein ADK58_03840 [Streptomyces sp. XY152]